ncbi:MAG: hypothetical protein IPK97_16235 [Ahniella sp.]|nr:hypothetical protein [Ahniella sp.]
MKNGNGIRFAWRMLFTGLAMWCQTAAADLTFQAFNNGGGTTRLDVVAASGVAVDSSNNAYFYGFGSVVPWDAQLDVMASSVSGTIGGSTLAPNQFLIRGSGFDGIQTGFQIALAADAGSLSGSNASIVFPIDPANFSVPYTLNVAFGAGSLGVITILPVDPNVPVPGAVATPVPLGGATLLIALFALSGLIFIRKLS